MRNARKKQKTACFSYILTSRAVGKAETWHFESAFVRQVGMKRRQ